MNGFGIYFKDLDPQTQEYIMDRMGVGSQEEVFEKTNWEYTPIARVKIPEKDEEEE